jgi:hypothetical protein
MSYWTVGALLLLAYLALVPCMVWAGTLLGWRALGVAVALGGGISLLLWIDRPPGLDLADTVGTLVGVSAPLLAGAVLGAAIRGRRPRPDGGRPDGSRI